jgi:cytochrome c biogenesis protein CcmG/thiol:disulfide interchange protein DsbE
VTEARADGVAEAPRPGRWRLRLVLALPLVFFAGLAGLFYVGLFRGDASRIPSALIGKPAPAFDLPPLPGLQAPGLASRDLRGRVSLVNVWASWCGPCRDEHPVLMRLARDGRIRVVGLNYKDQPENARRFLGVHGNPYAAVGVDSSGRAAIDWGVYGVPETYVVGPDGTIRHKQIGPLTPDAMASFRDKLREAARP